MKLLLLLTFLLMASTVLNAQSTPGQKGLEMTQGSDSLHAQVQLTKDLIGLPVCTEGSLQFRLRLNFSNNGKGPIILEKSTRPVTAFLVSRNSENAMKKKYEFVVNRLIAYDETSSIPVESDFVVLNWGESYSLEQTVHFYPHDSIRAGGHVLQLVVSNWHYLASNVEWRQQWNDKGYLWTDPITSVPMRFTLAKRTLVDCR